MELFDILFIFSVLFGVSEASCDSLTGPPGSPECVIIDGYNGQTQWATCLTDTYIKTFSKQKHQCEDQSSTYCYYQCMMELHTIRYGDVTAECRCNETAVTRSPESSTIIPDTCYSPGGDDCSWYRNCLEKRYPCKQQGESYAIDYAEKFCNLYSQHFSDFDRKGQQWINAVRKCLQVKLVPILRPFVSMTCDEIKKTALDSHTNCYLSPDAGAPSICDIGIRNWMSVFMTIKSAFIDVPYESLKQSITIGSKCVSNWLQTGIQHISISFNSENIFEERVLNTRIVQPLADNGKWDDNGIQYFGYSSEEDDSSFRMVVLLMPSKQYDLNYLGDIVANVTSAALDAAEAVESGQIQFRLPGNVQALNFSVCEDDECSESIKSVLVPNAAERVSPYSTESSTIILDTCYSPAGDDCSWYRNCLQKRYPCKQQGESYAIDYAETFCNLYSQHFSDFDRKGQQWINAVRKCLQVKLVPILRPFVSMTCDEIKKTALDSHTNCYLSPDANAPSICDIGIRNWMSVFMTIKSAFIDVPYESLKQSITIGSKCVSNWLQTGIQHISISFNSKNTFEERFLNTRIVKPLADNGKWDDNGIQYFGYSSEEDDSSFRMVVLLMPSKQYDLNYQGTIVANATSAALDAADAVQSGQVQFRLPGNVQALNFRVCEDDECSVSIKSVLLPITTNAAQRISPFCRAHLFVLLFVCYCIVKRWSTLE